MERRRRQLGLSARELGRRVGVSHVFLRALERGKKGGASPETATGFERELGVPFDVLLWPVADDRTGA